MEPMLETLFTINYSKSNFIPKLDKRVYSQEHIGYNQCPGCSHTDYTLGPVNHLTRQRREENKPESADSVTGLQTLVSTTNKEQTTY